jgi:hypothetical protein
VDDVLRLVLLAPQRLGRQERGVGLDQQPVVRHPRGGRPQVVGLRIGDVAGEGDPVAALQALVEAVGHREAVHDDA